MSSSEVIALPKCGANAQHIHELLGACFKVKLWKMKGKQEEESIINVSLAERKILRLLVNGMVKSSLQVENPKCFFLDCGLLY